MTTTPFTPHRLEGTPYRLDSVLGEGAMGEVYLGEHVDLRRPAVIKLIKAKYANEHQVVGRMRREARIVASIRHDALVTVYDLGTAADGRTYIAMEYLAGTVLRRILQTRGGVSVEEAARWMAQACDGLHVAHQAGVIHRDVKPENLFVTSEGQLKVLDFGVAKPTQDGGASGAQTAAGMVLGTPRYMAPEQATGRALSAATDVYAVGCVLFELLTGTSVFETGDVRELLYAHLHTPPSTLSQRAHRAFDPGLEMIVARALAKDPAQRYASAADLALALRALPTRTSVRPSAPTEKPTVRFDDAPTALGDNVHQRATVRVDAPVDAYGPPTHAVSIVPAGVVETSGYDDTRAIPAQNLVHGVSTTERAPVYHAHGSYPPPPMPTAQTEVLPEPATTGGTGALAAEVSTSPTERRATPLWPFALGLVFAAGVITALVLVLRAGREEPRVAEKPVATQKAASKPTIEPTEPKVEPSQPEPTATSKPIEPPAKTVEPPKPAKPTAATTAAKIDAAPTTSASVSAYDRARALMHDGDLDAAEREARTAVGTHGNTARLLLGEILERKGKPALARDVYKKILEIDPNNATAKTRLAKLGG